MATTQVTSNKRQETSDSKATSMADLMKKVTAAKTPFISPHKGDMLTGTITKLTSGEILVDINAKTEAVVLEKERNILNKILSSFKVGDKVSVQVLNPESDFGYPVVSLRKSIEDIVWDRLSKLHKSQEPLEVTLDQATKGGYLASTTDGISGFLPNSHTSSLENPQGLISKKIKVVILEVNRSLRKIIFSQKQVMGPGDFQKLTASLKVGQKIDAEVLSVVPFGAFLAIQTDGKIAEGFIHISEISWENVSNISDIFKIGDKVSGVIIGFDKESRRVNISVKRLKENPFEKNLEKFSLDKKLSARVVRVISGGVLMDLSDNIGGFIKKDKIPPSFSIKEGEQIEVLVSGIDKKRQRVELVPVLKEKPIGYR